MKTSSRRCGALTLTDGSVCWRVWAPLARRVELVLIDNGVRNQIAMTAESQGYFTHTEKHVHPDQRYAFRLDGGDERQDPCSLWQPDSVPGPSAVVDPAKFQWTDTNWKGIARKDLVIYELHVGTFTPEGTFEAIIGRLESLKQLGITTLEIMPIAQFPGSRNWGYDGVLPYAAQNSYGGPQGFHKLIDAAHAAGLAVILDVVYNHFGPEANYIQEFGPYFTDKYKTPWGQAVNYDDKGCDAVRDFVLDNVQMWLEEFHLDGLRLDAVHAIYDLGARHILLAAEETADEVSQRTGRTLHMIAESDLNDPRILLSPERGGYGFDAQWSDDFHHAIHAILSGETTGYYSDFGHPEHVMKVLQSPFLYAWHYSAHRGRKHGAPVPPGVTDDQFIVCIQNHDQVGNRAVGDRLSTLLSSPAKQRLAASLLLLSSHLPMLFMGEEYGETNPFPFFCSFNGPELIQAVREGRKREFADFVANVDEVPDPASTATFNSARLSWSWPEGTIHAQLRKLYADLLKLRKSWPAPATHSAHDARRLATETDAYVVEWIRPAQQSAGSRALAIYLNLSNRTVKLPNNIASQNRKLLFASESTTYGGNRKEIIADAQLLPFECIAMETPVRS